MDEAASPAQVALTIRKREPGNPGEAAFKTVQVAPKKKKRKQEKAGEAVPDPVQVAPKKKKRKKKREKAVEAAASNSAVALLVSLK